MPGGCPPRLAMARRCRLAGPGLPGGVAAGGALIGGVCGTWFRSRRRTYDVLAARLRRPVGFWPVRLASISMRGLGLVATQTLMFLFAGIEGSAAMAQRLGDAYAGVLAGHRRLVRAGLAAHGG